MFPKSIYSKSKQILHNFYFSNPNNIHNYISDEHYFTINQFNQNFLDNNDIFLNNPELITVFKEYLTINNITDNSIIFELEDKFYFFILTLLFRMYKKYKKFEFSY